jgi:WD40 repeat protein
MAISPDAKWAIARPAKGGPLNLIPTGSGESRQLTHDAVSYEQARFLPDGKQLIAWGIEAGHGGRDYLIDVSNGESKPVTPEGVSGILVSPDGKRVAVRGPDGKRGIWALEKGDFHPIPGLESNYSIIGWTPDSESVYVTPVQRSAKSRKVFRVNIETGKMEAWKTLGEEKGATVTSIGSPYLSRDGNGYAYIYVQTLSEAYVVTGLR